MSLIGEIERPMPSNAVIKAVLRAVDGSGLRPPARGIDLSCGDGHIIEALVQRGFLMEGTHFRGDDYILHVPSPVLQNIPLHQGVDLTRSLPFADGAYDLVLATEVLEHLPSHAPVLAEVGRVLRPGGMFICTTPNIHRLSSRARFFLTGVHDLCGARLGWHVPPDGLYSTHHNPVYFPVFHTLLFQNQMRITGWCLRESGRGAGFWPRSGLVWRSRRAWKPSISGSGLAREGKTCCDG